MITRSLVIIGGGASGIEAAIKASKNIDNILLVESSKELGGFYKLYKNNQIFKKYNTVKESIDYIDERIELLNKTNVEIMTSTYASLITKEKEQFILTLVSKNGVEFVKSRIVIDATGSSNSIKNSLFMSGIEKAQVFTIKQLFTYIGKYSICPIKDSVLYTLGDIKTGLLDIFKENGINIKHLVTPTILYDKKELVSKNVIIHEKCDIKEVVGESKLDSILVVSNSEEEIINNVDSLIFMDSLRPNIKLRKMLIDNETNVYKVDQSYESIINGLYVIGDTCFVGLDLMDMIELTDYTSINASKYRLTNRKLINIKKSLNIKYLSIQMLDLNLPLNDIKFFITIDEYLDNIENRKFKIFVNNELKIEKPITNFESITKPLKINVDMSNLKLDENSEILVSIE